MPDYDFKPLNLAQLYQGADASVAQGLQSQMLVMQASRMKKEFDEEDQLRTLAKGATSYDETGAPKFNLQSFAKGAYAINPMKAIGFEKAQGEAEKAALERANLQGQVDERRMKVAADKLKVTNEASTVPYLEYTKLLESGMPDDQARAKVQPMYEAALKNIVQSGFFKPDELGAMKILQSPQFDPTIAKAGMLQVLGAKDALAQFWEEKKFGETRRHNTVTETETGRHNVATETQATAALTQAQQNHLDSLRQQGQEVKQNEDGTWVVINKNTKTAEPVIDKDGKPIQGNKALTESQGKAVGFGQRATEAHSIILGLEADKTFGRLAGVKQGAENLPLVGGLVGAGANKLLSDNQQKYEQAQRDFINAVMRPESGATITPAEFDNAKRQYFPQAGDSAAVIKQKQEAREREIGALKSMAGPGAKQFPEIRRPAEAKKEEGAAPKPATSVPAVGTVQDGYKFKGGDPSKPESWEKV